MLPPRNTLLDCKERGVFSKPNSSARRNLTARLLVGSLLASASVASACTIPVFRYALERWESDRFILIVYHRGQLTGEQEAAVHELERRSSLAGGPLNMRVVRHDLAAPPPQTFPPAQPSTTPPPTAEQPLPWVQVLSSPKSAPQAIHWQGPLSAAGALPGFYDSPARNEIAQRILQGSSAVWLLVAPPDQLQPLGEQLQAKLDRFSQQQTLPAGIGLPGSELYASIPLQIGYSVLAVSHTDPAEQAFLKQLGLSAKEWHSDTAYVIPVFGRCRALEIIPHADIDELLIEEIATFLCGACSCRVKEANPGFDLLVSVNWNERLFPHSLPPGGHPGALPGPHPGTVAPPALASDSLPEVPAYVAIPMGNPAGNSDPQQPPPSDTNPSANKAHTLPHAQGESRGDVASSSGDRRPLTLAAIGGLLAVALLGGFLILMVAHRR